MSLPILVQRTASDLLVALALARCQEARQALAVGRGSDGRARLRATVVQRVTPL